jgi:DNA adenine methylase
MGDPLVKPFLKWAGGKRQLLPEIRKYLSLKEGSTYYEPFVGAGAVFFDLQPAKAVINDSNAELIAAYHAIAESAEELIALLEDHKKRDGGDYYYRVRAQDRDAAYRHMGAAEKAARLIYLNKTCYNGLYRVNSRGWFNVPRGRQANPAICEPELLRALHRYLRKGRITILSGDFASAVQTANARSFVYFDPPYHSGDTAGFTGYRPGGFGEGEQRRLRDVFAELAGRGVPCLESNADTPFIRNLYRRFEIISVQAKRAINSDCRRRGAVGEVLIRNAPE